MTPLHLAVTGPSSRAARWILEQRVGLLDVDDTLGRTALHFCASVANLELPLAQGSAVMHTDRYGMNSLHRACLRGELGLVRCLLKHNQPLDLKNNKYGTPLHCAIISGSVDVVIELLEAGAPVNAQDLRGNTPVHVAVRMGRYTILRNLLEKGGSRYIQNFNKRDPENLASILGTTHSTAALRILQGGRKMDADDYLFSESGDSTTINSGFLPHSTREDGASPPDFSWDTSDVAHEALPESNTSSPDEAGTMADEVLPEFPDGRKEREKLLENLTMNRIGKIVYGDRAYTGAFEVPVTPRLRAEITPYLDDSICQDKAQSIVSIGKTLAKTVFGIAKIMRKPMDNQQLMSPFSSQKGFSVGEIIETPTGGQRPMPPFSSPKRLQDILAKLKRKITTTQN